ncbi:hypothetical protein Pve01_21920 [Planomonospora venezuelensis]|nr:hypothetical protein Pve01_21920 [Planomonospora venezuelensis]
MVTRLGGLYTGRIHPRDGFHPDRNRRVMDAAYQATTVGDLAPLTRDLPGAVPPGREIAPSAR